MRLSSTARFVARVLTSSSEPGSPKPSARSSPGVVEEARQAEAFEDELLSEPPLDDALGEAELDEEEFEELAERRD